MKVTWLEWGLGYVRLSSDVRRAPRVYSRYIVCVCVHTQEAFYGREVELADRELVEQDPDAILGPAAEGEVALLVVGDPLG